MSCPIRMTRFTVFCFLDDTASDLGGYSSKNTRYASPLSGGYALQTPIDHVGSYLWPASSAFTLY